MTDSKRLAFVTPRYGDEVVGGSEAVMREAAHGLAARGFEVEVLTTCAKDHYTWANDYSPGTFEAPDGVVVHRFATVHDGDRLRRNALERRIHLGLPVNADEELAWINGYFRVPDLYHHLLARAEGYRAVILSPYLFWTTVVGATAAPERTVVIPCLHDENYAYLPVFRPLLARSAQVWFLSEPEHELAHRLGDIAHSHHMVGSGVPVPEDNDVDGFRSRHGLNRPYVLYAGRREPGKGWDDLLAGWLRTTVDHGMDGLDLVSVGVGRIELPAGRGRIIDLGFLPADEIGSAFAGAVAYVQPSRNESFSRTVMESWLAGTPVIASAASDVVAWHCRRSGGGLIYSDETELAECLLLAADHPEMLAGLAPRGREYVLANYTWDAVLDRMEAALGELA